MPLPVIQIGVRGEQDSGSAQRDLDRPTAKEIYDQVAQNARVELVRKAVPLAISGIAGGLLMGLTGLSVSILLSMIGKTPAGQVVSFFFYPLGFMVVILGRSQLFTENTLYPVALMLAERRHYLSTLRLWSIVYPANILGALLFALLAVKTGALRPEYVTELTRMGVEAQAVGASHAFWSGVVGGWIIASVAWLVSASHSITGSVMLIWSMTFIVGLGHFAHCIATSGEMLSAVLHGQLHFVQFFGWLLPATAGNVMGGVLLVTLLEYGQAKLQ
ncbi:MAG TPA: formate/nitrite transporter family protein [Acidobacteriaceae bacterium]